MLFRHKFELAERFCLGKVVLDLGCVGRLEMVGEPEWLHRRIAEVSDYVLGVDENRSGIVKMRSLGYFAVERNVQNLGVLGSEGFEVVYASALIEHLTNFDGFFRSVKNNLKEDGRLVLVTQNVHFILRGMKILLRERTSSPDHTCWFDVETLSKLLVLCGFEVVEVRFLKVEGLADIWNEVRHFRSLRALGGRVLTLVVETVIPGELGRGDLVVVAKRRLGNEA